jgi:acyl-CoA hydrolase
MNSSGLTSLHIVSASEAISHIKSKQSVFIHGGAATPRNLIAELIQQASRLEQVELLHLHTMGEALYSKPEFKNSFRVTNLFVGANMRSAIDFDRVDYLPCFLSEIPNLFRKRIRKVDVALIHVSPPDQLGFCSLGTSVDVARAATEVAQLVIAQVNPQMPRLHGDGIIHISQINYMVEVNEPIPEVPPQELSELELSIGRHVAEVIEDGACLQMGIGKIPDATLKALTNHKNLGIHTEMWSDGALDLILKGVVNNSRKKIHPGKTVSAFVTGSQRLYNYVNDNPSVVLLDVSYTNSPFNISRNPNVVSINSAVEIDLTGQVCADSIGHHIISGVGGQVDFMRGATLSENGKPVLALTSQTGKGISRIVPTLKSGAGVVTTRAHVHYVATEYGIVDLYGKTLNERAKALIAIAHPSEREFLERQWHDLARHQR